MAIIPANIKLLESERMTDNSDGGGRRTARVIPDGVAGNIFPKISRLDGVYGRDNLRKVYGHVDTANLDVYAGAHAVITDAPDNNRIEVTLFSTGSDFDSRQAARDRIESYVVAGPESRMTLYGRQLIGQQAIAVYQQTEEALPEVGQVLCLSTESNGVVIAQQFLRIADLTQDVRTFEDDKGPYQRRVITLKTTTTLRYEFSGPDTADRFAATTKPSLVRSTSVANAATYCGIRKLAEPAAANALEVRVESVYAPIVPTTQREAPLSNAEIVGASNLQPAAIGTTTRTYPDVAIADGVTTSIFLPGPVKPGSASLTASAVGVQNGTWGFTDRGDGTLVNDYLFIDTPYPAAAPRIDYEAGVITFDKPRTYVTWRFTLTHTPATPVGQAAHTQALEITIATRGSVYAETLSPIPAPGTLAVDFRALGRWYRLRDNGQGELAGDDAAYGTGSIDYTTGALVFTLGALPDIDSSVLMAWASPAHYAILAGAAADAGATVKQRITLNNLPVKPGTVSISYTAGVTVNTATDAGGAGQIAGGNLTGTINYASGEIELEYSSKLPNHGTAVTVNYTQETPTGAAPTSLQGEITVTDPLAIVIDTQGAAIAPKGLRLTVACTLTHWLEEPGHVDLADDGLGHLVTLYQQPQFGNNMLIIDSGQIVGTVNYATGAVSINVSNIVARWKTWSVNGWVFAVSA